MQTHALPYTTSVDFWPLCYCRVSLFSVRLALIGVVAETVLATVLTLELRADSKRASRVPFVSTAADMYA
jgi:hypothetical protein